MNIKPPMNFQKWIDDNRHLLKPPVCNQVVYKDTDFMIMVVGGPNNRKDYHYNETEEFFYQLEGEALLKINNDGVFQDVPLKTGDIYLLPPGVPHSPQRYANSVGLVIERRRPPEARDGFIWYCEQCREKLYEEYVHLTNIVEQLPPIFKRYEEQNYRKCQSCGFDNV